MHDDNEAPELVTLAAKEAWWLALRNEPWDCAEDMVASEPEFWSAMLGAARVPALSVRVLRGRMHIRLPKSIRSPVRAWLADRGVTLAHQPARWEAHMPVYEAG